jgi:molybdopterin molybdotransferase
MQEHCKRLGDAIIIQERPASGRHIRRPGEDVHSGCVLVEAGELLTARHLALLAACGCATATVHARIRVGLISTGSELVEPGLPLATGQIYNSNRTYLKARLDRPWISLADFGILADDPLEIQQTVRKAAQECDIVITTGGVSAGEEDHMLDVLQREAAELDVLKVAMRPGKPVTVGKLGSAMYFGLSGNPYACAITFMQIAWPAIRKAGGLSPREENHLMGIADFTYARKPGRTEYLPVSWSRTDEYGRPLVIRLGRGSSASLQPFASARAIAKIPADVDEVRPGDLLTLEPVDF